MKIENFPNLLYFTSTIVDGNIAYHVTDNTKEVDSNREKLAQKHSYDNTKLIYMNQIHSNIVEIVTSNSKKPITADAIITIEKNLPIMVMVADCIPIALYDSVNEIIAVVHAGRNGTFLKILEKTIEKMVDELGANVGNIVIDLGPSIGGCCYEVDDTLAKICSESFGEQYVKNNHIDLQAINIDQALTMGIKKENIYQSDVCTKCGGKEYFSYRLDSSCGRFGSVMMLK